MLFKYFIVGFLTVCIDYVFIFILYVIYDQNYVVAVIFGFLASNVFQFYSNFYFTFKLKKNSAFHERIILFWIAVIIGNTIGLLSVILFFNIFGNVFLAKTLSLPISFGYGYLVSKKIIYNEKFSIKRLL